MNSGSRSRALGDANEGSVGCLAEEVPIDEHAQHHVALPPVERPEPTRLGRCEAQTRHLEKLTANPFEETARRLRSRGTDLSQHGSLLVPATACATAAAGAPSAVLRRGCLRHDRKSPKGSHLDWVDDKPRSQREDRISVKKSYRERVRSRASARHVGRLTRNFIRS